MPVRACALRMKQSDSRHGASGGISSSSSSIEERKDAVNTTRFDDEESARQHADREAAQTRRYMAVVEDEGSFYVMTMRNADAYARPHPETVFIVYQAEPPAK